MAQRQFMRVLEFSQSSEFHHPIIFISEVRYPKLAKRTSMRAKLRNLEQIGGPREQINTLGANVRLLGANPRPCDQI
jgi:hypothetical protein